MYDRTLVLIKGKVPRDEDEGGEKRDEVMEESIQYEE